MNQEIRELEARIGELKEQLAAARKNAPAEPVSNFSFASETGPVTLVDLFGDHEDLLVIHNMGIGCRYCTLWADGLSAFADGIRRRAEIVLVSPDTPETQKSVRESRGWKFRMASDATGEFTRAMGYLRGEREFWPGVSGFKKLEGGEMVRTGTTNFGPGDDFCGVWPLFDLIGGEKDWEPK